MTDRNRQSDFERRREQAIAVLSDLSLPLVFLDFCAETVLLARGPLDGPVDHYAAAEARRAAAAARAAEIDA